MKVSDFSFCVFCFLIFSKFDLGASINTPCALRISPFGSVCVCNSTYCDYTDPVEIAYDDQFVLTSSSKGGLRFSLKYGNFSSQKVEVKDWLSKEVTNISYEPQVLLIDQSPSLFGFLSNFINPERKVKINVDRSKKIQKIIGFGGALTGSVSHILDNIPLKLQEAVYQSFYSKRGIGFSMMRMSIGGSDFDLEPWANNEQPENDIHLTNFKELDPRDLRKIEQINHLKNVCGINDIKIVGAAWSPPKWMKSNNDWGGFGVLKKEFYQTWADYHLKFLELMDAKNMTVWGISTGNEPLNGIFGWIFIRFMNLGWTPESQALWVADNLGPTIRNSKFNKVKILSNDDQRYTYPGWFKAMNTTKPQSMNFIDGFAVHWYWDEFLAPTLIDEVHQMYPEKFILSTESCIGDKPWETHGPELGSWERGEKYANSILEDLQHSFNGYIDWNLILNEKGGPNNVDNFVDSPVIVNTTSGTEFYKQPIFYNIGHFSKFIPEGSVRIQAEASNINIATVAFERPDGTITCVFFNSANVVVVVTLADTIRGLIDITIPAKSIHTIEYK